jgi:hypothetical protein
MHAVMVAEDTGRGWGKGMRTAVRPGHIVLGPVIRLKGQGTVLLHSIPVSSRGLAPKV